MIDSAMAARKPGRYLAPIALVAIGAAIFLVVRAHVDTTPAHTSTGGQIPSHLIQGVRQSEKPHRHHGKTYTVRSGDTLSGIASKTGVPVATIERLNPGLNPNALQMGQVLKLRR
jgi:LysM repeat protein